jgi:hypothetical protein
MVRAVFVLLFIAVIAIGVWYVVTHFPRATSEVAPDSAATETSPPSAIPIVDLAPLGDACGDRCGYERWHVKTLSDRDRDRVVLQPVEATVEQLAAIPRPGRLPQDRRAGAAELATYAVIGCLGVLDRQPESDGDIHLVIGGLVDRRLSLIAEIPSPDCEGVCQSGLGSVYARVRATLDSVLNSGRVSAECNNDVPLIRVTGVGFFDRPHGQIGAAPNNIELHPVLAVDFPR